MEVVDKIHKIVDKGIRLGARYIDVRFEERYITTVSVRRGYVEEAYYAISRGVGIRVLVDKSWGFSSTNELTKNSLEMCLKKAIKLAKSSSKVNPNKIDLAEIKVYKDNVRVKVKIPPNEVPIEEKVKLTLETDKAVTSFSDRIKDDSIVYNDVLLRKVFISSEGGEILIEVPRASLRVYANAEESGILSPSYENIAKVGGFEVFKNGINLELAKEVAERAVRLLKAKVPKGGLFTVVLDNKLLGLIVHEAFGHCAEADLVISGTILTGKIGEKVASELVTIVDDPNPPDAYGWIPYDDEGVKAEKVVIVEKGYLKNYMHCRETAKLLNAKPTGNARAQSYKYPPLVRMRNTYMLPGDWKPEEIIEETKSGYYLKGALDGEADANGEFMFSVQEAWKVENGELIEVYRGVTVSGNAIDVLKSVDAVGNDLKICSPGVCVKGQSVPVDGGGPHIRCKMLVGGR